MVTSHPRLARLDALRGIAALCVVIVHAVMVLHPQSLLDQPLFNLGATGVTIFFAISGYVIMLSLERTDLRTFWIRRFFRLYPLYWCSIIGAIITASGGGSDIIAARLSLPLISGTPATALLVAINATMAQGWLTSNVGIHLIGVYWTLSLELAFYILMSLLVRYRALRALPLVTITCALAELICHNRYGMNIAVMCSGVLVYQWRRGVIDQRWLGTALALTASMSLLPLPGLLYFPLSRLLAYLLLFLMWRSPARSWRPLVWLGKRSYSLYLWHVLVFCLVGLHASALWTFAAWVGVSMMFAALSYYLIERPAMALGRRLSTARAAGSIISATRSDHQAA